jgi:wyosine [tRNA(Phe)-imidazoG37] synthetase (radical SAM superfamily)
MEQNTPRDYRYLFGPVPSRRFGRSLGVDIIPFKTCTFNCVYCQLGSTTHLDSTRGEWVPAGDVLDEVRCWLERDGRADVISLAGSGEPTLHTGFGDILKGIRALLAQRSEADQRSPIRTCLLTNGSLFHLPEVRSAAALADIVKITLSAPDEATWLRLHRPGSGLRFQDALEGLRAFRNEYAGQIWIEVMIVRGVNDTAPRVVQLAELIRPMRPDRIQLNTVVRPPAERDAEPVTKNDAEVLAKFFKPCAEVVGEFQSDTPAKGSSTTPEEILALIARHPSSLEDVCRLFDLPSDEVSRHLTDLCLKGHARAEEQDGTVYYAAAAR